MKISQELSKMFRSRILSLLMTMIPKIFPWIRTQVPMTNITPRCGTNRSINRPLLSRKILKNKRIKKTPKEKLTSLLKRRRDKLKSQRRNKLRKRRTKLKLTRRQD